MKRFSLQVFRNFAYLNPGFQVSVEVITNIANDFFSLPGSQ